MIELFRADTLEKLKTRRDPSASRWKILRPCQGMGAKALDLSQRPRFHRIKGKVDRLKTLYDRLTNNSGIDVFPGRGRRRSVSIMEMATARFQSDRV